MAWRETSLPELLEAAHAEPAAAAEIVRRYEPLLRRILSGRIPAKLRGRMDTQDALQSALTLALRDLPKVEYRGERAFRNWLVTVALRRLQQAARFHQAARRDVRRELVPEAPLPRASTDASPSEGAAGAEERARLRSAVGTLEPVARRIVELRGLEGRPFPEIAEELGLPGPEAARQRYLRALAKVRERLAQDQGSGTCPPKS